MPRKPLIFVSHSARDRKLVGSIRQALLDANVTPIFYSDYSVSTHADPTIPCSEEITNLIKKSCAVFILLGKNVSRLHHTQGWIGFEIGIASTVSIRRKQLDPYGIGSVYLVEDISQKYPAAIPYVDYVYLFDFKNTTHWQGVKIFANLKSHFYRPKAIRLAAPITTPEETEFRLRSFNYSFHCPWPECRAKYELWIYKGDYAAARLPPAEIHCSVCRHSVKFENDPSTGWVVSQKTP